MVEIGWLQLILTTVGSALGGGLTLKVLDIFYQEFRRRSDTSRSAEQFVDKHLDPLLKSADELVGKLRSLAESDFRELHDVEPTASKLNSLDYGSLLYLFSRFWAQIEISRHEGLSVAMNIGCARQKATGHSGLP
jgi:hypothetical protein